TNSTSFPQRLSPFKLKGKTAQLGQWKITVFHHYHGFLPFSFSL
uniref:Uncharacterized protein n=1 Tax=Anopheles quadriannulatus TaxID=34691 RepID=A0A182XQ86_ANOQN